MLLELLYSFFFLLLLFLSYKDSEIFGKLRLDASVLIYGVWMGVRACVGVVFVNVLE